MARTAINYDTTSKTKRLKLAVRTGGNPKPYYRQIGPGRRLGYLRRAAGNGSWVVAELIDGRPRTRVIGQADDIGPADGTDVLTFEQAQRKATDPAAIAPKETPKLTVKDAIERYCANLAARSGNAKNTEAWAKLRILPVLGDIRLNELTRTKVITWQTGLVTESAEDPDAKRRSKSTANRILTILKAALNEAYADQANGIATDTAWRLVKPFKAVDGARQEHFESSQVRILIAKAAEFDACFAALVEVAYLTGARLGELASANVRDFDPVDHTLRVAGKTGARNVSLTDETVAALVRITKGRKPTEALLPRTDGERWKNTQHRPMQRALALAELTLDASFYTLRHSYISRAIEGGMPLSLIAENCGTSLLMIQRNYAKVLVRTRRDVMQKTSPSLRLVAAA